MSRDACQNSISRHEAVMKLLSLMQENGRWLQAMELSHMVSSIDNMDKQYSELLSMVRGTQELILEAVEHGYATIEEYPDYGMHQEIQDETEQILAQLATSKEKITTWAETAVEDCSRIGVGGLNAALFTLNVRGMVNSLRKEAHGSALNIIDIMLCAEKNGIFQSPFLIPLRPIRACQKFLSRVGNAVCAALGGAEHLTESAEAARTAHAARMVQAPSDLKDKPSIHQTLKKNQSEIAVNSTPAPDRAKNKEATL